jgi:outer membrane protein assembly factor BamB
MRRFMLFMAVLIAGPSAPLAVRAQSLSSGLLAPESLRQVGLERMWFTQMNIDRSRGRVAGIHLHVSSTQAHTVFQIAHEGKRYVFSQRERNAFGKEIGTEGAKKKAEAKLEEVTAAQAATGKSGAQPPVIESYVVPQMTIYATSQRGSVHAIDGETGRTLWTVSVGDSRFPTTTAGANDRHVGVCNGSTLYVLLAEDGAIVWQKVLVGAPVAGPAMSDEYVFSPTLSGHVESFLIEEPKRPAATFQCFGRTLMQPVVSSNSVAWCTDGGNLYVALAHEPGMRFRMQAKEAINAAPAFMRGAGGDDPDKVLCTSLDGYVYCVHERRGNILWRYSTGEPISHSPIVLGDKILAITDKSNMYALDATTASEQWVASGIRSYVSGSNKRLYCIDNRGNLAILDAASGSRLGDVSAGSVNMPLMNSQTDRLILGSSTGLLQCVREAALPFPIVHFKTEPLKKKPAPLAKGTPKASEKAAPAGDAFDPFNPGAKPAAAPPSGDPFANPGGAKPTTPPAGDPFGSP